MAELVTLEDLADVLGTSVDNSRGQLACDAANQLVPAWQGPPPLVVDPAPEPTPAARQAALEVAHHLYRNQAEPGGFVVAGGFSAPEAALPGDLARRVRDLLDVDTTSWGLA